MGTPEKAKHLLDANANNIPVQGGVFLANALQQVRLDYTEDSLKRIDALLDQMREKIKPAVTSFLEDIQKENFALTLAFYLGEYIARNSHKTIEWLSYDDAIKRFPPEHMPQKAFHSHVVGFIGNIVIMPLVVLDDQLFNDNRSLNARKYVDDVLSMFESQAMAQGNEWRPEYLDWFLNNQKIPGGVQYSETLKQLKLDFSLDSLKRIDGLLGTIRIEEDPNYGQFISRLSTANFIWLLSTYVARTTAQLAKCSLKWVDFNAALNFDSGLKEKFETTYCCVMGDRMVYPILMINEILFAPQTAASCRRFAEAALASDIPRLISLYRDTILPEKKTPSLLEKLTPGQKMVWQTPVRQAGFLAAHGAFMLAGGLDTPPVLLQPQTCCSRPARSSGPTGAPFTAR